ncbi:hypothetical protein EUGRSUZ_I00994 [Eucalyptus grandis]|uniref:Uncharacterized protein n=2 Tax=Eucalyptus grandis TaxID=71139 RepID=A0ACC3JGD5_EUCGR|nr:hypothetical protein EUGRSUZ_I00994 [Eucalyptus grandis]
MRFWRWSSSAAIALTLFCRFSLATKVLSFLPTHDVQFLILVGIIGGEPLVPKMLDFGASIACGHACL